MRRYLTYIHTLPVPVSVHWHEVVGEPKSLTNGACAAAAAAYRTCGGGGQLELVDYSIIMMANFEVTKEEGVERQDTGSTGIMLVTRRRRWDPGKI